MASLDSAQDQHWAIQYIGTPWQSGATGPDAYDCWGFFRQVQQQHYQITVFPVIDVDANRIREVITAFNDSGAYADWIQVEQPLDGDAVLMAHAQAVSHIGVWVETPGLSGVLHCVVGLGVVFSSLSSLQAAGWGKKTFWRYVWA
jgi:hypothetical protein